MDGKGISKLREMSRVSQFRYYYYSPTKEWNVEYTMKQDKNNQSDHYERALTLLTFWFKKDCETTRNKSFISFIVQLFATSQIKLYK
jgi:hypothetical protein